MIVFHISRRRINFELMDRYNGISLLCCVHHAKLWRNWLRNSFFCSSSSTRITLAYSKLNLFLNGFRRLLFWDYYMIKKQKTHKKKNLGLMLNTKHTRKLTHTRHTKNEENFTQNNRKRKNHSHKKNHTSNLNEEDIENMKNDERIVAIVVSIFKLPQSIFVGILCVV